MHFSRYVVKFLVPFTVNVLCTPDLTSPFGEFHVSTMKNRNLTFVLKSLIKSERVVVNSGKMRINLARALKTFQSLNLKGEFGDWGGHVEGNWMG